MVHKSQTYKERKEMFIEALSIGDVIISATNETEENVKTAFLKFSDNVRSALSDPDPKFQNLKSLAYVENDYFAYWNEATGEHVEKFWKEMSTRSFPFGRKDILQAVLKRKKIKDEHEYHYLVDSIVVLQQEGRITHDEAALLSRYMDDFENKAAKRKNLG